MTDADATDDDDEEEEKNGNLVPLCVDRCFASFVFCEVEERQMHLASIEHESIAS